MKIFYSRVKSDGEIRDKWIAAIETYQKFDCFAARYEICEGHFDESDFIIKGDKRTLKPNSVPSKFPEFLTNESTINSPNYKSLAVAK